MIRYIRKYVQNSEARIHARSFSLSDVEEYPVSLEGKELAGSCCLACFPCLMHNTLGRAKSPLGPHWGSKRCLGGYILATLGVEKGFWGWGWMSIVLCPLKSIPTLPHEHLVFLFYHPHPKQKWKKNLNVITDLSEMHTY